MQSPNDRDGSLNIDTIVPSNENFTSETNDTQNLTANAEVDKMQHEQVIESEIVNDANLENVVVDKDVTEDDKKEELSEEVANKKSNEQHTDVEDVEVTEVAEATVIETAPASESAATEDDDSGLLYTGIGLLGLGGLGAAAGGSDSAEVAPVAPVIPPQPQVLNGNVLMGPLISGNGLSYNVYKIEDINADGSVATGAVALASGDFDSGSDFSVNLDNYAGTVVVRVSDDDTTNGVSLDYLDEATGVATDLTVTELNAALVMTGEGEQTVNINVFTQTAYELALAEGLAADSVENANDQVTNAVGLVDDIVSGTSPIAVINVDGTENTAANTYGQLIAAASGVDESADTATTVASLVAAVTDAANPVVATANLLLAGAVNVEDVLPSFGQQTELTLADYFFIADSINKLRAELTAESVELSEETQLVETNLTTLLNSSVTALEALVAQSIATLSTSVAAQQTAITDAQALVDSAQNSDIAAIDSALTLFVSVTEANTLELNNSIANINSSLTLLTAATTNNSTDIQALMAETQQLADDIDVIDASIVTINTIIADLEARIEILEAQPETNELDNSVDLVSFTDGITIDMGAGDDFVNASSGDDVITGGQGADQINLTTADGSADTVVFANVTDGQSNQTTTVSFATDAEYYREGTVLTVNVNGVDYSYTVTSDDGENVSSALQGLATQLTSQVSFESYADIEGDAFELSNDWDDSDENRWIYRDSADFGNDFINWYADGEYNDMTVLTLYYAGEDYFGEFSGESTNDLQYQYPNRITPLDIDNFDGDFKEVTLSELMQNGGQFVIPDNMIALTPMGDLFNGIASSGVNEIAHLPDGSVYVQGQTFTLAGMQLIQVEQHQDNESNSELMLATADHVEALNNLLSSPTGSLLTDNDEGLTGIESQVKVLGEFSSSAAVAHAQVNVVSGNEFAFNQLTDAATLNYYQPSRDSDFAGQVADFEDLDGVLFANGGNDLFAGGQRLYVNDDYVAIWDQAATTGVQNWGHYNFEPFANGTLLTINDFTGDYLEISGFSNIIDSVDEYEELSVPAADLLGLSVFYMQASNDNDSQDSMTHVFITNAVAADFSANIDSDGEYYVEMDDLEDASFVSYAMFTGDGTADDNGVYGEDEIAQFVTDLLGSEATLAELTLVSNAGETLDVAAGGVLTGAAIENTGVTTKYDIEFPEFAGDWPTQRNGDNLTEFDRQVSITVNIDGEDTVFETDILYGEDINGDPVPMIYETLQDLVEEINYVAGEDSALDIVASMPVDYESQYGTGEYDWEPTQQDYFIQGNSEYGTFNNNGGGNGGGGNSGPGWDVYTQTLANYDTSAVIRIESTSIPENADDVPNFTVNASIEENGTQQQTLVSFSMDNSYYYEGGEVAIEFGDRTVTASMVAGNAEATMQALATAIQTSTTGLLEFYGEDSGVGEDSYEVTPYNGFESYSYATNTGNFTFLSDSELTTDVTFEALTSFEGEQQEAEVRFSTDDDDYYDGGELSITIDTTPDVADDTENDVIITSDMVVGNAYASIDSLVDAINLELDSGEDILTATSGEDGVITLTSVENAYHVFDIVDTRINYVDGEKVGLDLLLGNQYLDSSEILGETLSVTIDSYTYEVDVTQEMVDAEDTSQAIVDALVLKIESLTTINGQISASDTDLDVANINVSYNDDLDVHVINFSVVEDMSVVGANNLNQFDASVTVDDGVDINETAAILNIITAEEDLTPQTDAVLNAGLGEDESESFLGAAPGDYQASDDTLYMDDERTVAEQDLMDIYSSGTGAIAGADETYVLPSTEAELDEFFIRTEDLGVEAYSWDEAVVTETNSGSTGYDSITGFQVSTAGSNDSVVTFTVEGQLDNPLRMVGTIELTGQSYEFPADFADEFLDFSESIAYVSTVMVDDQIGSLPVVFGIDELTLDYYNEDTLLFSIDVVTGGVIYNNELASYVDVEFYYDVINNELEFGYVDIESPAFEAGFFGESGTIDSQSDSMAFVFLDLDGETIPGEDYLGDEIFTNAIEYTGGAELLDSIHITGDLSASTAGADMTDYRGGVSDTRSSDSYQLENGNTVIKFDTDILETDAEDGAITSNSVFGLNAWDGFVAFSDEDDEVSDLNGNNVLDLGDYAELSDVDVWDFSLLNGQTFASALAFETALNSTKVIDNTGRTLELTVGEDFLGDIEYSVEHDDYVITIAQNHLNDGEFFISAPDFDVNEENMYSFAASSVPTFLNLSDSRGSVISSGVNSLQATGQLDSVVVHYFNEGYSDQMIDGDDSLINDSNVRISTDGGDSFTAYTADNYASVDSFIAQVNAGGQASLSINDNGLLEFTELDESDELVVDVELNALYSSGESGFGLFDGGDELAVLYGLYLLEMGYSDDTITGVYSTPESLDVTAAELTDAEAAADLLNELFNFDLTTDNGEINTTVFAINASDDASQSAVWVHTQSSTDDTTVEAEELTLLTTVETEDGELVADSFMFDIIEETPVVIV